MTGPTDDLHKKKADEAARYLAESFFGLNMSPADVGGEVLFDDYDDVSRPAKSLTGQAAADSNASDDRGPLMQDQRANTLSSARALDEDLDDLIVFSDDEEDEVDAVVSEVDEDEDDDENFDFGDEDDEDDDDDDLDEEEEDEEEDDE